MAATGDTHDTTEQGAMDISAHRAGYERFMGWMKIGAVVSFVVAAVVVVILAS